MHTHIQHPLTIVHTQGPRVSWPRLGHSHRPKCMRMCAHTHTHTHLSLPAAWLAHTLKACITHSCPNTRSPVTSVPSWLPPQPHPHDHSTHEETVSGKNPNPKVSGQEWMHRDGHWAVSPALTARAVAAWPLEAGVEGPPCRLLFFPGLSEAGDTSKK